MNNNPEYINNEAKLEQLFGRQNCFRVPDGYFCNLEKELMEHVTKQEPTRKSLSYRLRPWGVLTGAAASLLCAIFMLSQPNNDEQSAANATTPARADYDNPEHLIDELSDYAMLENGDFYSYVSGE